jgi:hypothetical protein
MSNYYPIPLQESKWLLTIRYRGNFVRRDIGEKKRETETENCFFSFGLKINILSWSV